MKSLEQRIQDYTNGLTFDPGEDVLEKVWKRGEPQRIVEAQKQRIKEAREEKKVKWGSRFFVLGAFIGALVWPLYTAIILGICILCVLGDKNR